ncbi:hypothetical protein GCM10010112_40290 [Actinoplanes lobatus]|uniref:Lipoprotein n=1 Tax=Actinoplanes lobatus TaxID=113568 RepID=A0A7W7HNU8_9ACTN|nr:hypothetical protein [Actinoplanes lobatus]MBB4753854.1 hypothetical protein [Actinoplanes lobatus]GGN72227.1 hypothetical protein GCM10010112_40290 [Actinoplanes lobatus]GIE41992.1 hypothetical protein Alo02nite_48900 [Actinoplanes lobatus]
MKRFLAGAVAGVTALTLTVGCANQFQQLEPKLELKKAAENLGAEGKAGFTIKAGGNVDDVIALAKKESTDFTDEDAEIVRKIYNSSVSLAWDKAGESVADDRVQMTANLDGITGLDVRTVDEVLYVRVPVTELAQRAGASSTDIAEMRSGLSTEVPTLAPLFDGEWVSVAAADLKKLGEQLGGATAAAANQQEQSEKLAAEFRTSAENLLESADVVRDEQDKKHLIVTTSTGKAIAEAKRIAEAAFKILAPDGPADAADSFKKEIDEKAPADKPIVLDIWVDNGKFTAFEINYLQFFDGATGRGTVRIEVADSVDITAPSGAQKLDVAPLFEALAGAASGGGTSGAGAAESWAELVGQRAVLFALTEQGKPADYLKKAAKDMAIPGVKVQIVRKGVAQVTSGTSVACVTVPATTRGEPKVKAGAC